jgi:RNA polymerase sigma-70 factor (ECF subfamily)
VSTPPTYNEPFLFQQLQQGSEAALAHILRHYYPKLMGFAISLTKSKPVAEEFVQETFLRLWLKREELDLQNLNAWLHRVLANLVYSHLKRLALDDKLRQHLQQTEVWYDTATEHQINQREAQLLMQQAVEQLSEKQKMVYLLSREQGLSREEIARELGISPNTVKNHMANALESIRDFVNRATRLLFNIF